MDSSWDWLPLLRCQPKSAQKIRKKTTEGFTRSDFTSIALVECNKV